MAPRKKAADSKQGRSGARSSRGDGRFRPPRPGELPAEASVPSFLRLPISVEPGKVPPVDVVLSGVPFELGASARPGARFGPSALREASALALPFSAALGVDTFAELTAVDAGDVPGGENDLSHAVERAERIASSGAIVGFVGGDQSVTLAALRGLRGAKLKAFNLLHIDARSNTAPGASARPESAIRLAVEESLVRPDATLQVGIRGPFASPDELAFASAHGFEIAMLDEVRWDLHSVVGQVRDLVRRGALYVSVDVSALDPAYAPGVSCPAPGGMTTWELQQILRALVGAEIVGFDVVEIAPPYDHAGLTSLVGVTILHELFAAIADTRRSAGPAPSTRRAASRGRKWSP